MSKPETLLQPGLRHNKGQKVGHSVNSTDIGCLEALSCVNPAFPIQHAEITHAALFEDFHSSWVADMKQRHRGQ